MKKYKYRLVTTHITRENTRFTKECLESVVKQINEGHKNKPVNISHDKTKQIGFIISGFAKLIQLEDSEFAVEAEIHVFESEKKRIKYSSTTVIEEKIYIDFLKINGIKIDDVNCPTYMIEDNIFEKIDFEPKWNKDKLLIVDDPEKIYQKGILVDEKYIIIFHPFLRRAFSVPNAFYKRLIDKLKNIKIEYPNISIAFSVLKNSFSLKSEFKIQMEFDYMWGPKFPKDLDKLQFGVTKHSSSEEDKKFDNITETDFWWHEGNDYKVLEIEELRDKSQPFIRGNKKFFQCKYSHLQYDSDLKKIIHLDCAIRIYSEDKYEDRISKNNISKTGKQSDYIKLFRLDGNINPKDAFDILSFFYHSNTSVREYFDRNE